MPRLNRLEEIERLYAVRGGLSYGENVTQMEHALQCATLAQDYGAPPSLIIASLLHDIGHLLVKEEVGQHADDRHQVTGAKLLGGLFGEAVCGPVALHVAAKRYLCFKERQYFEALSPASRASLIFQGGAFDASGSASFERRAYFRDAVSLRRFDDTGKRQDASTRSFAEFVPLMRELLIENSGT